MSISLSVLFKQLATLYHADLTSEHVDVLLAEFVSTYASIRYTTGCREHLLAVVKPDDLSYYEGIHLLLGHYGLGLTQRLRQKRDVYLIGVRSLSCVEDKTLTGRVKVKPLTHEEVPA